LEIIAEEENNLKDLYPDKDNQKDLEKKGEKLGEKIQQFYNYVSFAINLTYPFNLGIQWTARFIE